ncbi:MAG: agmatine deiminase family protein [candidate division WOR-3 bacterium]
MPFLPQWLTPEEAGRISEIGRYYQATAPPEGWVETPAEFEPVRGVFITWIYSQSSYRPIFREIVREVAAVARCYIIASAADTTSIKSYLISGGVPLDSVVFYVWPYNSIWIRDYGPWFIRKADGGEGIVDFIYNRPRPLDDTIPRCIGYRWFLPVYSSPLTHPGGNFMVDGLGTGFASNLVLQENSQYTRAQIDSLMRLYSGLDQFIILPRINIEYTGHIDLWTKILNDTLIMVGEYAPGHPNYTILNQNADTLTRIKNREGINYRVVRIPMPYSTSSAPPTYLNSLFVNNKVLVPTWGLAEDSLALAVYRNTLPGHQIVGINCQAMSGSGGAIHCITMQVPSRQYLHIKHRYLVSVSDTLNPYPIRVQVISSSAIIPESTMIVWWQKGDTVRYTEPLVALSDTPGVYRGYIPAQSLNDTVCYYLTFRNTQGLRRHSPNHAPAHYYQFVVREASAITEAAAGYILGAYRIYPSLTKSRLNLALKIDKPGPVQIGLYNILGAKITTVYDGWLEHGIYNFDFDFKRQRLPAGSYILRIVTPEEIKTSRIVYLR